MQIHQVTKMNVFQPEISIKEGKLLVQETPILCNVPESILLTHISNAKGTFLGGSCSESKSHHVFKLGLFEGFRFFCCFRFRFWWMAPRMGSHGIDIPSETQMLLVDGSSSSKNNHEGSESNEFYILFLPVLDGLFRSSLQGNERNELELCIESGDPAIQTSEVTNALFINAGSNPFELIRESMLVLEKHIGSFKHRESKQSPGILDWFGWCTWDAFYRDVRPEGVEAGLRSLKEGHTPARLLILDDGWQDIENEFLEEDEPIKDDSLYACRLRDIKENKKFGRKISGDADGLVGGLEYLVKEAKHNHNVKYVYVWHTIGGYWGGVQPLAENMTKYEATIAYAVQSPGILENDCDKLMTKLESYGFGIISPTKIGEFYNDLHSYLASVGVDGVKVDSQNILEAVGAGLGGRVFLARTFHEALESSVRKNFPENGCISCMCHSTDSFYSSKQTAIGRASEDFFPQIPIFQTIHVASVAYNSFFIGEVMHPDWDMFHSRHPAAEFHAAARAVGGCGVYVSDKPGEHDFDVLRKLVLPDGSVLRARLPGRPTRDCLFNDPTLDGISLLKIWNMNTHTGVLGVFNCQGAGWCKEEKKMKASPLVPGLIKGLVSLRDVELLHEAADKNWNGDCAIYAQRTGNLVRLTRNMDLDLTLKVLEYEVYTITPIKDLGSGIGFAPLGLIDMYNSGGAIKTLQYNGCKMDDMEVSNSCDCWCIKMRVHGCGRFGAYSTLKPKKCSIGTNIYCAFDYNTSGLLTLTIPSWLGGEGEDCIVTVFLVSE